MCVRAGTVSSQIFSGGCFHNWCNEVLLYQGSLKIETRGTCLLMNAHAGSLAEHNYAAYSVCKKVYNVIICAATHTDLRKKIYVGEICHPNEL